MGFGERVDPNKSNTIVPGVGTYEVAQDIEENLGPAYR
jgi:hypothetical protein